jgi:putative zinc finger/helix-turn-helix YgiT family protein
MTETISCPNGHGEMAVVVAMQDKTFKGERITYQTETYECKECGLNIGTIEQAAAAQNAIADAYRKIVGLLTGQEIKEKRAAKGWSQKELAERSGVGIASIKRWENGIIQTRSVNEALINAFQNSRVGNIFTGNRDKISLSRIKLVLKRFEAELGFGFLNEGDMLLFDAKYSWYADMLAFKELGMGITGADYAALPHGPQINNYKELVELIREADESEAEPLTEEEMRIITRVARAFPTKQQVIDAAHREVVWKRKGPGQNIPYSEADELTEI